MSERPRGARRRRSQRPSKTSLGTSRQAVARPLQRCLRTSRRASERPTPRGLPRRSTRVRHRPPRRPATRRQSARAAAAENVSGATLGSPSTPSANTLPEALANQLDTVALRPADYVSESLAGALGALRHTLRESPSDVSGSNPASPATTLRRALGPGLRRRLGRAFRDPSAKHPPPLRGGLRDRLRRPLERAHGDRHEPRDNPSAVLRGGRERPAETSRPALAEIQMPLLELRSSGAPATDAELRPHPAPAAKPDPRRGRRRCSSVALADDAKPLSARARAPAEAVNSFLATRANSGRVRAL